MRRGRTRPVQQRGRRTAQGPAGRQQVAGCGVRAGEPCGGCVEHHAEHREGQPAAAARSHADSISRRALHPRRGARVPRRGLMRTPRRCGPHGRARLPGAERGHKAAGGDRYIPSRRTGRALRGPPTAPRRWRGSWRPLRRRVPQVAGEAAAQAGDRDRARRHRRALRPRPAPGAAPCPCAVRSHSAAPLPAPRLPRAGGQAAAASGVSRAPLARRAAAGAEAGSPPVSACSWIVSAAMAVIVLRATSPPAQAPVCRVCGNRRPCGRSAGCVLLRPRSSSPVGLRPRIRRPADDGRRAARPARIEGLNGLRFRPSARPQRVLAARRRLPCEEPRRSGPRSSACRPWRSPTTARWAASSSSTAPPARRASSPSSASSSTWPPTAARAPASRSATPTSPCWRATRPATATSSSSARAPTSRATTTSRAPTGSCSPSTTRASSRSPAA